MEDITLRHTAQEIDDGIDRTIANEQAIEQLGAEASAKWETLNRVENQGNANAAAIAVLQEILTRNGMA